MNLNTQSDSQNVVQEKTRLGSVALIFLAVLFIYPAVAATLGTLSSTPESRQYGVLLFVLMGLYNLPAITVSGLSLIIGKLVKLKSPKAATILYITSALASVVGIGITSIWLISIVLS
jgi:hypothetical protein